MIDKDRTLFGLARIVVGRTYHYIRESIAVDIASAGDVVPRGVAPVGRCRLSRWQLHERLRKCASNEPGGAAPEHIPDTFSVEATGIFESSHDHVVKAVAIDISDSGKVPAQQLGGTKNHYGEVSLDECVCVGWAGGRDARSATVEGHERPVTPAGDPGGISWIREQDVVEAIAVHIAGSGDDGREADARAIVDPRIRCVGISADDTPRASVKDQGVASPTPDQNVPVAVTIDVTSSADARSHLIPAGHGLTRRVVQDDTVGIAEACPCDSRCATQEDQCRAAVTGALVGWNIGGERDSPKGCTDDDVTETVAVEIAGPRDLVAEATVDLIAEDGGMSGRRTAAYDSGRAAEEHKRRAIDGEGAASDGAVVVMSSDDDI